MTKAATVPILPGVPGAAPATLSGWGMRDRARGWVARPQDGAAVAAAFAAARVAEVSVGLRGAGCSYGDAALNASALTLDCSAMDRILAWDGERGLVTVEPGVTIAQLWRRLLPEGWAPTVVPGMSAVTVGGAAAANVHGKNNWRVGCFGDHIQSFDIILSSGARLTCSREDNADLFHAAIGGMGLFGCFTSLTLHARRVHSGLVATTQTAHGSLDALMAALDAATDAADELVTWIDTSARGPQLGRGLLRATRDLAPGEDPHPERTLSLAWQERRSGALALASALPNGWLPWLARPLATPPGVALANRAQWTRGQLGGVARTTGDSQSKTRPRLTSYVAANFLLDLIPNWKDAYKPGGLAQHQSFVPRDAAPRAFRLLLEHSQAAGIIPSLAVLKAQRSSDFLLDYLVDGYSLALDYPMRRATEARTLTLLHELNDITLDHGGRVYLAKDDTLTSEQATRMYAPGTLARFHALKAQYDPDELLQTNLYRRVLRGQPMM
ncbi:MAG TPA: FAD-binding oxidoreductase [Ktedonobacterales bacterium]|nr:FAD-binding oxidoreductase [Ktedonobacterales bacterium]